MSKFIEHKEHQAISWKLPTGMIVFILLILVGFMFRETPKFQYEIGLDQMHDKLKTPSENTFTLKKVASIIRSSEPGYQFIDLRSPQEFLKGHIPGAINIPIHRLLDEEFSSIWNDTSKVHILYSEKHSGACAPWMLLQQMGFSQNKIMIGGYINVKEDIIDRNNVMNLDGSDEKPRYNFAKVVSETAGGSVAAPVQAAAPAGEIKKAKSKAVSGGC